MKKTEIKSNMLTGRVILLNNDKALFSPVLVGNIYPKGKGEELISHLSQIYSEKQYRKYIKLFCKRDYGYFDSTVVFSFSSIKDFTENGVIDFRSLNYETAFYADWIYFKNNGRAPVKMIFRDNNTTLLESRETIVTRSGKATPYPQKEMIKTKDTIKSIVLIEKTN